jgi:alcohol dehydrogenase (cytochrome c)
LIDTDPRGSMGLGGTEGRGVGGAGNFLTAIDYRTGAAVWRHEFQTGGITGLLSTAVNLVFAGIGSNLIAFDATTGKSLWHSRIGNQANAPEAYMLDGHQYLLAVAGDTIFAFTLY